MNHGKHKPSEQIVALLQKANQPMAAGEQVPDICRDLGISELSFYRWRTRQHGMSTDDAKRLRELEKENATLKLLLAAELEQAALKEIASGTW